MTHSPTRRSLISVGEILIIIASSLSVPFWPAHHAHATIASPGSLSSTAAPTGIVINSPWLVDTAGTEWAYGTTASSMGTLISRNRTTLQFTTKEIASGDQGAIAGSYSPITNMAIFSARRAGAGNRIVTFDLATGTRIATRTLAVDENNIQALAFNPMGASYIIGTNQNPAKVMKFETATGALEYSSTLGSGLKEITALIPSDNEVLAAVNTSPVKLVPVSRNRLVLGNVFSLPAGTPTLLGPIVVGNTAYLGTNATPGRITAIDIPTRTVVGFATLNSDEIGARNLAFDESTGTLYATTDSGSGPRFASFRASDLSRLGTTQLGAGSSATSLLLFGRTLAAGFADTRGVETFTVAPEPNAPVVTGVQESDSALTVSWSSGGSIEPILDYTASATAGASTASCTSTGSECAIRGLQNGNSYTVSVTARSAAGVSAATMAAGTPRTVPESPTVWQAARGNSAITVSWTPRGDGGSPIIGYRATASPGGRNCESVTPTCTITGLTNGIPHVVSVVAHNSVGFSQPSEPSGAVTPATTPHAPRIESVRRMNQGAVISWEPPADDGGDDVVSYLVRVIHGPVVVSESTTDDTSITVDGLVNGIPYDVVLVAENTVGPSAPSESVRFTPATIPSAPVAVIAQRHDAGTTVSWEPSVNDGGDAITSYRVNIRKGDEIATNFVAPESPFSIHGLDNGTTYSVTVSAVNSVGEGIESEHAEVTPATVPDAPNVLSVAGTNGGLSVEWSPPLIHGGDPVTGYRVRVWHEATIIADVSETATRVTVSGLTNGREHRVTVSSINSVGEGIASAPSFGTPVSPPVVDPPPTVNRPAAPVNITVLATSRKSVTVGWSLDDEGGAPVIDYIVHTSRYPQRGFTVLPDATSATPQIELRKPRRGSLYLRVIAVNSAGESSPSVAKRVIRR
jgi:titin